jgi:hypothetical protein
MFFCGSAVAPKAVFAVAGSGCFLIWGAWSLFLDNVSASGPAGMPAEYSFWAHPALTSNARRQRHDHPVDAKGFFFIFF